MQLTRRFIKQAMATPWGVKTFKIFGKAMVLHICTTLEIQSSHESTRICLASHSGNKQYTHSPIAQTQNINQTHRCIWYRRAKSVAVLPIVYSKTYLLVSGLDMSPLVFFRLVKVLSNCVHRYFQMHAWFCPSSWAIVISHCQTLQLSRCLSGFQGYLCTSKWQLKVWGATDPLSDRRKKCDSAWAFGTYPQLWGCPWSWSWPPGRCILPHPGVWW